ncbi:glycosyltransferase family 4 protein [Microbacterium hominis]|uniref:glycosyltransferase family 4 protein n=1 Tax=Microbacterium hominis TaxID=162426 RepID=UPI001964A11D|nr:glycosyltransferase family 4 protein [Microbacterium hominis]QRY41913.1 glycosyltransferase family 4 protein [Microbacterium hominis]
MIAEQPIVLFAKGFPPTPGGVEQYSQQVALAYQRAGFDVYVITQTEGPAGWRSTASAPGPRVYNVGAGGQLSAFFKMMRAYARLPKALREAPTHATTWRVATVPYLAAPGATRVITVHGREILNHPRGVGGLMRRIITRSDLVMAVSSATRDLGASAGMAQASESWQVSYNGVSWGSESASRTVWFDGQRPLRILSLSRLVPRKNHISALQALRLLRDETGREFVYRIAGTGNQRARLEEEVARLGLSDRVEFLGYVDDDDVPELYKWADVFLHPHTNEGEGNDFEGFGLVIADSMLFGCVAVSGLAGGPAELIDSGVDGLLVDGGDVEELAATLKRIVGDPALVRRIGERAQHKASERFSWDEHILPVRALLAAGGTR